MKKTLILMASLVMAVPVQSKKGNPAPGHGYPIDPVPFTSVKVTDDFWRQRPTASPFDDTDVYKTIEGASYLLQTYPDKRLENYIDSVLVLVAAAQEPDGYLYTSRTMNPKHPHGWSGSKRWEKVEDLSHEFYNLGHMVEGAIAHYQATGKRNFLDIAIKYADCPMPLAKLYLATGDRKYLDQAKYFLDKRGY